MCQIPGGHAGYKGNGWNYLFALRGIRKIPLRPTLSHIFPAQTVPTDALATEAAPLAIHPNPPACSMVLGAPVILESGVTKQTVCWLLLTSPPLPEEAAPGRSPQPPHSHWS